jgi:hypothetical protein
VSGLRGSEERGSGESGWWTLGLVKNVFSRETTFHVMEQLT